LFLCSRRRYWKSYGFNLHLLVSSLKCPRLKRLSWTCAGLHFDLSWTCTGLHFDCHERVQVCILTPHCCWSGVQNRTAVPTYSTTLPCFLGIQPATFFVLYSACNLEALSLL
jgi:hypothetical protein